MTPTEFATESDPVITRLVVQAGQRLVEAVRAWESCRSTDHEDAMFACAGFFEAVVGRVG